MDDITFDLQFDDDEDDCILVEAVEASAADMAQMSKVPSHSRTVNGDICGEDEDEGNISIGCGQFDDNSHHLEEPSGFDRHAGQLWIYPTNYPIRDYQYNIVQQALFRNTLVVLPTGLGKTFIAAVVMYNLYRWFPQGKVVFMAPTKPLVAQQILACYNIMGIPKIDTIEMTGNLHPTFREKAWRQKRVIFLTPQVMTNDISRGSCAAKSIKCVVVDEAHKALGNHAYCQVIRELVNFTAEFRVLALSATPGSDLKAVQQVMANLLISHIELRSEDSIDICPYTHERKVDKIVVPMGEELSEIRLKYIQIMQMVVQRLVRQRVLYNREPTKLSKFLILKARDEYRQNPPQNFEPLAYGNTEADFALAMSIYHGYELLQLHGLRSLFNFLKGIKSGDKGYGRTRYELMRCSQFNDIMEVLYSKFMPQSSIGNKLDEDKKVIMGHPKMQRLEEVVLAHFKSFQGKNLDTRVMIFSQYRDSVEEIRTILDQHHPLVRVMAFIGQSSNGKITKGYTQKEQLKVMRQFREGGFNTLVSTCVGEEGLDIGDVDLIVCFDAHKSPIRLVQRMGRTGRRRQGRIVMLVTEGKEEQIYNQSLHSKKSIHKAILNGARTLHFYTKSPRLIPADVTPKCHKMYITVRQDTQESARKRSNSKERRKSGGENVTISAAFSKQASRKKSGSTLSREEYEEIRQEFSQLPMKAKHVPYPKCLMLKLNEGTNPSNNQRQPEQMIKLSEWMPWQNRLHHTHLVGHSTQSVNLVKDAQFIELQQSIGESGNVYGLEMDIYVSEGDIIRGDKKDFNTAAVGQGSIRSFLIPSQKQSDDQKLELSRHLKYQQCKVSHKKDAVKHLSKDKMSKNSMLFTQIKKYEKTDKEDSVDLNEAEAIDAECEKDGASFEESFKKHKNVTVRKRKISKRKLLDHGSSLFSEFVSIESKRASAKRQSILEILTSRVTEQDEVNIEDFDTIPENDLLAGREKRSSEKSEREIKHRDTTHIRSNGTFGSVHAEDNDCQETAFEKDTESTSDCRQIHIPTPPRIEEVADLIAAIVSPSDFTDINLFEIIFDLEKTNSYQVFPPERTSEENSFSQKVSQIRINGCNSEIEHFNYVKKRKESCVQNLSTDCTSNYGSPDTTITMNSPDRKFDFPADSLLREFNGKAEDQHNTLKSPSFKSAVECRLKSNTKEHQEISEKHMASQKCYLDANTYSERLFEDSKNHSGSLVNVKVKATIDHQECPDLKIIEKSYVEAACQNLRNFSLVDTLDSFLMDIDVDLHTSPGDKNLGDEKEICSTTMNKSMNSTGLATFTQAMACLHSSSSENTHEEEEELCLDPKIEDLESRFEEKSFSESVSLQTDQKRLMKEKAGSALEKKVGQTFKEINDSAMNDTDKTEDACKSSQRFSPQQISPSLQQAPDSDVDLFFPQFELGFDFESEEIIPPTPEKKKNSFQLSTSERMKTQDTINQNHLNESGVAPPLTPTNVKENAHRNIMNMNESDLGLFEEVQNIERMNINPIAKNILNIPNHMPVDETHLVHHVDEIKSFTSPIEMDASFEVKLTASGMKHKTTDNFNLSPSKRKKLPFSSYTIPSISGNRDLKLFDSTSSKKCDVILENEDKIALESPQPQSTLKKKKLSLKKSSSKENVKESFVNVPITSRLPMGDSTTDNVCGNSMTFEAERKVSTPIKDFHGTVTSGIPKVGHLTPIRGSLVEEDSDEELLTNIQQIHKMKKIVSHAQLERETLESAVIFVHDDGDDDDEDDFTNFYLNQKSSRASPTIKKRQQKKFNKKIHQNLFIEDEAAESGNDVPSEEEEDDEDCYEGSFIDSRIETTQAHGIDMRAVYLKSVKSPPIGLAKASYRLNSKKTHSDIYSQALPEDQGLSEYEEDSFCVGSEEEDISMNNETFSLSVPRIKKKVLKKVMKGKRRVRVLNSSSSDEDGDAQMLLTQECAAGCYKAQKKALVTSSEEEQSILCKDDSQLSRKETESTTTLKIASESNMDTSKTKKLMSELQYAEKGVEKLKSRGLENDAGSNFDLLDMNEWFNDLDAFEDAEVQNVEKQGSSGKETEREESSVLDRESFAKENDKMESFAKVNDKMDKLNVDICTDNSSCLTSFNHESIRNGCNNFQIPSSQNCLVKPIILEGSVNAALSVNSIGKDMPKAKGDRMSPSRAERLKKQKEKKERYQLKLAQIQQQNVSLMERSLQSPKHDIQDRNAPVNTASDNSNSANVLKEESSSPKPLQVLVDSREISSAQEIISALRLKHKVTVTTRQLLACDYILSNYMAVDRLQWSEFGNSGNRTKLSSRLCDMQAHYQKCVVIIEADRVKCGQEKLARAVRHTKYLDKMLSFVIQTGIKLYFTDNSEQTAALLFELCEMEQRKGRSFIAPTNLNPRKEEMLNFVTSLPSVTMAEGLNLVHRFKSIAELVSSPVKLIHERGSMSFDKAQWIYAFLRHHFNLQMAPSSSR